MCDWAAPRTWLIVGLTAHPVRWLLSSIARDPVFLLAIQLTHALTFGVFYLAAVQTVERLAPDGLRTTAQGVFAAVTFGVGGLVGNGVGGLLYEAIGMTGLYIAAGIVSGWGTFLYVVRAPREGHAAGSLSLQAHRGDRR
jgi:MFS family permease